MNVLIEFESVFICINVIHSNSTSSWQSSRHNNEEIFEVGLSVRLLSKLFARIVCLISIAFRKNIIAILAILAKRQNCEFFLSLRVSQTSKKVITSMKLAILVYNLLSCLSCPVLLFLSSLSCYGFSTLAVLFCLSRSDARSCSSCPILSVPPVMVALVVMA